MCLGTFSRRGAVASATIYPCAECASSRSAFYFIGRIFLWNKKDPLKSGSDSLIIKSSYCSIASIPETGLLFAQAGSGRNVCHWRYPLYRTRIWVFSGKTAEPRRPDRKGGIRTGIAEIPLEDWLRHFSEIVLLTNTGRYSILNEYLIRKFNIVPSLIQSGGDT